MSQSKKSKEPEPAPSFWSAIAEVIRGLAHQPILLFGFGLAIVVFAAGALAIENLRVVAGALLVLAVLAMIVWIALKAFALSASRSAEEAKATAQRTDYIGGKFSIGKGVKMEGNKITAGTVVRSKEGTPGISKGGDLTIGNGSELNNNEIHSGEVK